MTRDQVSELSRLATDMQRWLDRGNLREPPFEEIRALARLANIAANTIEHFQDKSRNR